MDTVHLPVPPAVLEYARFAAKEYVPPKRTSGFKESDCSEQQRGDGDQLELIAKLTLKHHLVIEHKRMVRLELTSGSGDDTDLTLWLGRPENRWYEAKIDVKTSNYAPCRTGLNLFVKEREALTITANYHRDKSRGWMRFFVQCFVHLTEADDPKPHLHIAGVLPVVIKQEGESPWTSYFDAMTDIPNTGGFQGMTVPIEELKPWESFIQQCRPAW